MAQIAGHPAGGREAGWAVAALGASAAATQLTLLREILCAFSGNELVLGVGLGGWLLLSGAGAAAGRWTPRLARPAFWLAAGLVWVSLIPFAQVFCLRVFRDAVLLPGSAAGLTETAWISLLLLAPYCLVSGVLLPLAVRLAPEREGMPGSGAGTVYIADAVGGIAGGALFTFVLVLFLEHFQILAVAAIPPLAAAALVLWRGGWRRTAWLLPGTAAATLAVFLGWNPDAQSTARQYPGREVLCRAGSPYGALVVAGNRGQYDFIRNGAPLYSSGQVEAVETAVHPAMAQRPQAKRVLLVGGGFAGTVAEVLKYGVREVTYIELDPVLLSAAARFLGEPGRGDARVRVVAADGRRWLEQAAPGSYDVIIFDVPPPDSLQLNRFYTAECLAAARRALAPDGVLAFPAGGEYYNSVGPELAAILGCGAATAGTAFRHVLLLPFERVWVLASDGELTADAAGRLEAAGVPTRLVNRHYLDAVLAPDRLADMARAQAGTAAVNRDFDPVLFRFHLQHWLSRFRAGWAAPGLIALGLYLWFLARQSAEGRLLVASGFAAASLEVVLLLAIQVIFGSVYRETGVVVTVFMAGLAAGAWAVGRCSVERAAVLLPRSGAGLAAGALLVILLSAVPPHLGGSVPAFFAMRLLLLAVTFGVAWLTGCQFPLAVRLRTAAAGGATVAAARLYTADFLGASLGGVAAGALLLPALGMAGTCVLCACLCLAAAIPLWLRRSV